MVREGERPAVSHLEPAATDVERAEILARLRAIEAEAVEYHRRSAHRETVIDRLHEENQQLRADFRRTILEPVVADLIRLYDHLLRDSYRLGQSKEGDGTAKFLQTFAEDVEL